MQFLDPVATAPTIRIIGPLAALLGAAERGVIDYRYEDAVRLAGQVNRKLWSEV